MFTPGVFALAPAVGDSFDFEINTATVQTGSSISDLEGLTAATIQAKFAYGDDGETVKLDIQTSLDQGTSWVAVARIAFTTSSQVKIINLSGLTPVIDPPYEPASLDDDIVIDGILGDRLRVVVTSTGTYTGATTLSVRAILR